MRMAWLRVDLRIPMSHSLKEKRRPVKSLIASLRNRFNLAVAEVDAQDLHQRAVLGIALVGADGTVLANAMREIKEHIQQNPDCQLLDIKEEILTWRGE